MSSEVDRADQVLVWHTGGGNPRNGEADVVELPDGRLFLAYTRFSGGDEDQSAADIRGCFSVDDGRSWGAESIVVPNTALCNVMCVNLLRLQDGRIMLVYLSKNGQATGSFDARPYVTYSSDNAVSWSPPVPISTDEGRYYVLENSRLIQLTTGRIIIPLALLLSTEPWWFGGCCAYSDDGGNSWKFSEFALAPEYPLQGFVETGVIEVDGSRRRFAGEQGVPVLMMYARSCYGEILHSFSMNAGVSWSRPEPLGPRSPISPSLIKRLPSTGDLLLVWNDSDRRTAHPQWRSPLSAAISRDEGQTWSEVRDIEADTSTTYCYPSVTETASGHVILTYYRGETVEGRHRNLRQMVVRRLPTSWFYGGHSQTSHIQSDR